MIWLQLIIPVVVICSKLTVAEVSHNSSVEREECLTAPGVALIKYDDDIICSGVHLKSWIVLTIADCVKDRDASELMVGVKILLLPDTDVRVKEIELDPDFNQPDRHHNFALLYIYGKLLWCVGSFLLPKRPHHDEHYAYIEEWDSNLKWSVIKVNIEDEYEKCGSTEEITDWYCVTKGGEFEGDYNVGIPVYHKTIIGKRLLGMRSGTVWQYNAPGYFFQNVYPCLEWIKKFMRSHPLPP